MDFKYIFCLLSIICTLSLGYAQCPDSVRVYVNPEVICPGEFVHLSTDSTLLHCVNIGDIICVHNFTSDTAIVSPSDWTDLGLASSYNPLSVVFYVDSTCQHGWAVQCTTYETQKWDSRRAPADEDSLINYTSERSALSDLDGFYNTNNVPVENHPAFASCTTPFYLPAIGQLNILFPINNSISSILTDTLSLTSLPDNSWWSSTENTQTYAYYLDNSGVINSNKKTDPHYVIPVMNF